MQVRRFEATTMKDALSAVKKELGSNAVILSTKEVVSSTEGVKLFEVKAASAVQSKAGAEFKNQDQFQENTLTPELLTRLNELGESIPTKSQIRLLEGAVRDVKTLIIESLRTQHAGAGNNSHLFAIEQSLKAAGVDESLIADLSRHLNSLPPPAEIAKSAENIEGYYRDQAMRWMLKRIRISPKWNATPGITNVHTFVGTPGSGKSTLMAKIASDIHRRDRHKVSLASLNTAKVAGSEQLRIFAKVLGIPHFEFSKPHELKKIVLSQKNTDIILVDAPGCNPFDTDAASNFEIMKNLGLSLDFHLVISATEKVALSERAISCFSNLGLSSLAITKLDECPSYGEAFGLTAKWSLPLSYLTFSGEYSDGMERATRERILERIFNL